jgi:hypothetical protein
VIPYSEARSHTLPTFSARSRELTKHRVDLDEVAGDPRVGGAQSLEVVVEVGEIDEGQCVGRRVART